jgi:hypothetical protein
LGWGFGIAALGLLIVAFYDVFGERQADFMKMIGSDEGLIDNCHDIVDRFFRHDIVDKRSLTIE